MKKTYTQREMDRLLRNNGWAHVRTTGSHREYKNRCSTDTIALNIKPNRMVCRRLIKAYGLVE